MKSIVECDANYVPLTPISLLDRTARAYPNRTCMIYKDVTFTWNTLHTRCIKIASALSTLGLHYADVVAVVAPNIPELYELHFAIPMAGGVVSPLNPKLDETTSSLILQDLDPKFVFVYQPFLQIITKVLSLLQTKLTSIPFLVQISTHHDISQQTPSLSLSSCMDQLESPPSKGLHYDDLLDLSTHPDFEPLWKPKNECDPILVSYTSGSTGKPKGVIYTHRSTYLNTLGEVLRSELREGVVFLWTADMFRANGWGFIWAVAALAGTNVCLTNITGKTILDSIHMHGITHLSGHPSILLTILDEEKKSAIVLPRKVYAHIAGVLPPHETMVKIQEMGLVVVHRYGMTEVLGPPVKKLWKLNDDKDNVIARSSSSGSPLDNIMEEFDVKDPNSMESVACDGVTIGEIMFKGNTVMKGYLKCGKETNKVLEGGWFHTGDLAVKHCDGEIQIKDRAKDVIVYKGEWISTLEIEEVLLGHPKVVEAAVVGIAESDDGCNKDEFEVPCAFVKLKAGVGANAEEIIKFCGKKLPVNMIPRYVIFGNLAVSSTGKVQKFVLKEIAKHSSDKL